MVFPGGLFGSMLGPVQVYEYVGDPPVTLATIGGKLFPAQISTSFSKPVTDNEEAMLKVILLQ